MLGHSYIHQTHSQLTIACGKSAYWLVLSAIFPTTPVSNLTELNLQISYPLAIINRFNLAYKNYAH